RAPGRLPALAGIAYRRKTLAKFSLLPLSVLSLLSLAGLLLGTGTGGATAGEYNDEPWDQKQRGCQPFHRTRTIFKLMSAATSRKVIKITKPSRCLVIPSVAGEISGYSGRI